MHKIRDKNEVVDSHVERCIQAYDKAQKRNGKKRGKKREKKREKKEENKIKGKQSVAKVMPKSESKNNSLWKHIFMEHKREMAR